MSAPAIKLTTYFGERERVGDQFLADALLQLYERHQMRASVLLRGVEGFGPRHHLHTDRLLSLSESLPAVAIAIDAPARVERLAGEVLELAGAGLTTLERARLLTAEEPALPVRGVDAVKLTLYGGRSVRADGQAGYVAAIERLRAVGAAGASVLLAVDGTLHGERRRARFFSRNAGVPLMLLAIGERRELRTRAPGPHGPARRPRRHRGADRDLQVGRRAVRRAPGGRRARPVGTPHVAEADGTRRGAGQARRTPPSRRACAPAARGRRGGRHDPAGGPRVLRRAPTVRGPDPAAAPQRPDPRGRDRFTGGGASLVADRRRCHPPATAS